jgi:hypothetical protein
MRQFVFSLVLVFVVRVMRWRGGIRGDGDSENSRGGDGGGRKVYSKEDSGFCFLWRSDLNLKPSW